MKALWMGLIFLAWITANANASEFNFHQGDKVRVTTHCDPKDHFLNICPLVGTVIDYDFYNHPYCSPKGEYKIRFSKGEFFSDVWFCETQLKKVK